MDDIEISEYFICPISLQMMKDPVTTITGISYDRESIQTWLKTAKESTCPVTKQPLPRDSELTSNHTLRRFIQSWFISNGVELDRIPTPKPLLSNSHVLRLIRDLRVDGLYMSSLIKMEALAKDNERNRRCMEKSGLVKAMVFVVIACYNEGKVTGLEEALRILCLVWSSPSNEIRVFINENQDLVIIDSLIWVLRYYEAENLVSVKSNATRVLKMVIESADKHRLERLNPEFFIEMVRLLRENISQQATKSILHILIKLCPIGRSKSKSVKAEAVFELIELALKTIFGEKKMTELIFSLLAKLCSLADGRFQFLSHAGGIAMVSKRILRVSRATDEKGIQILTFIAKFCATNEVLTEMLSVGAVTKLCMVTQADCEKYLKDRAKDVLRMHTNVWNNSPCIAVYLLTRHQR